MIVREFLTRLGFDADEGAVRSFDGAVRNLTVGLTAVVGAATAASVAAFNLAQGAASYGDEVAKTARQIGIGTNALQEYRFAFDRLGVSEGETTGSLERFNRAIGRAAAGTGTEAEAFEALGISVTDAGGRIRGIEELLPELADALSGIESEAERAAIAQDLLGRSGGRLISALAEGGEVVEGLREEFRLLGGGLSEDQARGAEDFTDSITNLRTALNGLKLQIGAELMPAFRPMIDAFTQFVVANRAVIMQGAERFFEHLAAVMGRLVRVGEQLIGWAMRIADAFTRLNSAEQAALAVGLLFFAFQRLGRFFVAGALIAAMDQIAQWMDGQPGLISSILGPYEEFAQTVASVIESVGGLENVLRALMAVGFVVWAARVVPAIRAVASALMLLAANPIGAAITAIALGAALIISNWDTVGPALEAVFALIIGAFEFLRDAFVSGFETISQWVNSGLEAWQRFRDGLGAIVDWLMEKFDALMARIQPILNAGAALAEIGGAVIGGASNVVSGVADTIMGRGEVSSGSGGRGRSRTPSGAAADAAIPPGTDVVPSQPVEGALSEIRDYLEGLQGGSVDVSDGSLMGDVDQSQTANISLTLQQSITVPPGTTAEQLAVIRRESEAAIERAAGRAAASLEM